jgi:hypothetical protein
MMPALGRGIQNLWVMANLKNMPNVDIMFPIYIEQSIVIGMLLFAAWKFQTLRHPATYLALAVNGFIFLLEPLGRSIAVQTFLRSVLKG